MSFVSKLYALLRANPGDWATTGPDPAEYPLPTVGDIVHVAEMANHGEFHDAKWNLADYKPMHPGRIGRAIVPRTLMVHTTDMKPGTFNGLVKNWTTKPGAGNGAHFLIGKTTKDGVIQFVPVNRNANHAGGRSPGLIGGLHPNTCSVGVELDNAGRLVRKAGKWVHPDTGYVFADKDVWVEKENRAWEKLTLYQRVMLWSLWKALKPTLRAWSAGSVVSPNASYSSQGVPFAAPASCALMGHVSVNPVNKTDPGPEVMQLIKGWS